MDWTCLFSQCACARVAAAAEQDTITLVDRAHAVRAAPGCSVPSFPHSLYCVTVLFSSGGPEHRHGPCRIQYSLVTPRPCRQYLARLYLRILSRS